MVGSLVGGGVTRLVGFDVGDEVILVGLGDGGSRPIVGLNVGLVVGLVVIGGVGLAVAGATQLPVSSQPT